MGWQQRQRPASFRGVPFYVPSRARSGGRRGPTHEFPQEDLPDAQDTGRKARTFRVEALVIGDDYMDARDALLAALDQSGPGLYVDPWSSEWKVVARRYSCLESDSEGGLARFSVEFEESGDERYPTSLIDTAGVVGVRASAVTSAAVADFARGFSLVGMPGFVVADAKSLATMVGQTVFDGVSRLSLLDVTAGLGAVDPTRAATGYMGNVANAVRGDLAGLTGDLMTDAAAGIYVPGPPAAGDAGAALAMFNSMATFGDGLAAVPVSTSTRAVQVANRQAMVSLVRRLAVSQSARAAASLGFDSADAALAVRSTIGAAIDALASAAGGDNALGVLDDESFTALSSLRGAVNHDLVERAARLPRIRRHALAASLPAVVVAYRLFGDAALAADLVARNAVVTHPGFLPDGVNLEVLGQ